MLSSSLSDVTCVDVGSAPDSLVDDVKIAKSCALLKVM